VLGLEHDTDALGRELLLEPVRHLLGETLLNLEVSGEELHDACELGESEDSVPREVPDVGDALEGQHVVLAEGVERDVSGEDEFVVALVVRERGEAEGSRREHLGIGGCDAPRCLAGVLVLGVLTECHEEVGDRSLRGIQVDVRASSNQT
jgi:hypothetical protein